MKDISRAEQALRKAHEAGDIESAQKLAAYIRSQKEPSVGRAEAAARGAFYGAVQQPRDVIAAGYARLFGDVPFEEGLQMAREASLEGDQGKAMQERPGYFTGGQIAGNIATTLLPAAGATKAISATAPALSKIPVVGNVASNIAKGIGASKGFIGVPAAGAVQGATSTLMTEGDLSGALPGAVGAGVIGAAGKVARPVAAGAISKARQGYTNVLRNIGIDDFTPGQLTGSKNLETIDAALGEMLPTASAARNKAESQLRKFTKAALAKAGINADEFTPEVREMAEAQFGKKYGELFKGLKVKIDDQAIDDLSNVISKQIEKLDVNQKPLVNAYLRDILQNRNLSGEAYQAARSELTQRANSMSDKFTGNILRDIRNTLDKAAERAMPESKKGLLSKVNKEYSNFKILQKAASGLSQDSLEGIVPPLALSRAVETANKTKGMKGYGDLYELSRAGRAVLADKVPNSGTAQRMLAQQLLTAGALSGGIGGGIYGYTQDPSLALTGAAATLALPKLSQLLLNSPAAQSYFTSGIPVVRQISTPTARNLSAILAAQSEDK